MMDQCFNKMVESSLKYNKRYTTHTVAVYYRTSTACDCGSIDSVYGMSFDQTCATCEGRGVYYIDTLKKVHGIINKFSGNKVYLEDKQIKIDTYSDSEIKVTFLLNDILVNKSSSMGATYLDGSDKIGIDGRYYQVKFPKKIEIGGTYVVEAILNEVKR